MAVVCSVQDKIPCLFDICVVEGKSSKKNSRTSCKILAVDSVNPSAELSVLNSIATEKIDGTSCFVREYNGEPWLWIRHDQKPTKTAEKRFKKQKQNEKQTTIFKWDPKIHLKPTPENWIPMLNIEKDSDGNLKTTSTGHIPGWVPVDQLCRSHCWHLSALDLSRGLLILLQPSSTKEANLYLRVVALQTLMGKTLELIGTHINGNPYRLGSKNYPFHVFVEHGAILVSPDIPLQLRHLNSWFETDAGQIEGIVWHTKNGQLFKIHRHHLNLQWPIPEPRLRFQITKIIHNSSLDIKSTSSDHLINLISSHSSHLPLPLSKLIDDVVGK